MTELALATAACAVRKELLSCREECTALSREKAPRGNKEGPKGQIQTEADMVEKQKRDGNSAEGRKDGTLAQWKDSSVEVRHRWAGRGRVPPYCY